MGCLKYFIIHCAVMSCLVYVNAETIYVSLSGNDSNAGTIDLPYLTIPKAVSVAFAGDTIFVRGGTYLLTTTISISKDGTSGAKYYLYAYPTERPLLDFSGMVFNSSNRGINLSGDYWCIYGIDIKGAGDNGMNISGSNNKIEYCSFYENQDTGLQLSSGASNNQIINCDSYFNADPSNGNADGFAPKLNVGSGNYFYGCRAWQNSDDGWDGYLRESLTSSTIIENCWCFNNGYLKNGSSSSGNGNGFKMGGGDTGNSDSTTHEMTLRKCLSFDNRVKGFDQNNNRGSMTLLNCTGYRNGTNYGISAGVKFGETITVKNCVALGSYGSLFAGTVQSTNSWQSPFSVSNDDFISVDTTGIRGARQPDGSLPQITFLNLAEGSDLIDAGTDVGLSYHGTAPDLGAFETNAILPVELSSFDAFVNKNCILLKWKTATENDNYGFEVERMTLIQSVTLKGDQCGSTWKKISFVKGNGTSNVAQSYSFADETFYSGINKYRLKQIDRNGAFQYSWIVDVNNTNLVKTFSLSQNYPNPFNPVTTISYQISERSHITLKVFNLIGEEIVTLVDKEQSPGYYSVRFDASTYSSGMYVCTLKNGARIQQTKMLLLK